ncbi:MAG: M23 family metallopeptidase [Actinobacteria bacterium]|nr:M23 family metallopeptidase [Actinomycetota bacterium]
MFPDFSKKYCMIGQFVQKDQLIGYVGTTGYTTFPHLHLEVKTREVAITP